MACSGEGCPKGKACWTTNLGIDIWRPCRFWGYLLGLGSLPGGYGSFSPCQVGGNLSRKEWAWSYFEATGSSVLFLDELLTRFQYLSSSGAALLAATLLGYVSEVPSWSLPSPGHVAALVLHGGGSG